MRRRTLLTAALAAGLADALAIGSRRAASAREAAVRLVRPVDLTMLPLLVMEHEHLIERTAEAMGLGAVAVSWGTPDNTDALAAVASGRADFAAADLVPFILAAAGGAAPVRGLGALAQRPYVLVTRNPAVATIRDFATTDRIAVPALKVSGPAVMLEMAATLEWGIEQHDRLSRLATAMSDEAAAAALTSGTGEISTHFSRMPYVDRELARPGIRRVMDSFDIAGPHTTAVLAGSTRFRDANPELCKAVLSALQQAGELIEKSPGAAAEIFAAMSKEPDIPLEDLSDMIGDPDLGYRAAPVGVMRIADFLHRIGSLKSRPATWQELFFPESRDLPGR